MKSTGAHEGDRGGLTPMSPSSYGPTLERNEKKNKGQKMHKIHGKNSIVSFEINYF